MSAPRVVLVTGAARGIGRATALAFAREGASLVVSDVLTEGEATAAAARHAGASATFVRADVTSEDEVSALVAAARATYGRLDVAVNNAGIEGPDRLTAEIDPADWQRTIEVNLTAAWRCMRHELPLLQASGGGAIVNVASVGGLRGHRGAAAYVASKHGLIGLTRTAAIEYAPAGIRVNAVCPAAIHTSMIDRYAKGDAARIHAIADEKPVRRLGTPEEVADAIVWLASDRASFVIGHALVLDGGTLAGRG
jgi:NAD(P)-dependent dehydrogenase (short-subunit alcohol dehydrogenase family)